MRWMFTGVMQLLGNVGMTYILQTKKTDYQGSVSSSKHNANYRNRSILKQQPNAKCEKPP